MYFMESTSFNEGGLCESFGRTNDRYTAERTMSHLGVADSLKNDGSDSPLLDVGLALLAPNLGDKTSYIDDFKLEYMDLDDFLSENGMPVAPEEASQLAHAISPAQPPAPPQVPRVPLPSTTQPIPTMTKRSPQLHSLNRPAPVSSVECKAWCIPEKTEESFPEVDFVLSPQDLILVSIPGQDDFDPRKHKFTDADLKPRPVIKKSKKVFVSDCAKDDRYWSRRKKNNVAAKRSRDARRVKENQVSLRACYLEKENASMKEEVEKLRRENSRLKILLSQAEKSSWHTSMEPPCGPHGRM